MTENPDNPHSDGEIQIIRDLLEELAVSKDIVVPPGDDCAAVRVDPDNDLLFTSDPVIQGVHFTLSARPEQIGHKAAGRVLSDLAAMGAAPKWILLNIASPSPSSQEIRRIVRGAQGLARSFGASIVGGDVSSAPVLSVNAFACGTVPTGTAVKRKGALVGDMIYVTGELGNSSSGKHLDFTPRVKEGIWLRENNFASTMIDTSDGPATDLRHILGASGVGARLALSKLPISHSMNHLPQNERIARALCEGEDFELLFSVSKRLTADLESRWKDTFDTALTCLGTITDKRGELAVIGEDGTSSLYSGKGFEHFG